MGPLARAQADFLRHLILWLTKALSMPNVELTLGEGRVYSPRPMLYRGAEIDATDRVHGLHSKHHIGLAQDINLFVDGEYIRHGEDPVWVELGQNWKDLHTRAIWGGDFDDANHLAWAISSDGMTHQSRAKLMLEMNAKYTCCVDFPTSPLLTEQQRDATQRYMEIWSRDNA